MSNIISILKANTEKYPHKIAIQDMECAITYAQLWEQVRNTAAYYNHKNIKAGDRVLVFVPMSVNLYVNMLAIFYIGATAVFLDQWSSTKRLDLACQIAECKAMVGITKAKLLWFVSSAFRKIPVYLNPKNTRQYSLIEPYSSKKEDTALITFTTGSTGKPKAAKRTHQFLLAQFHALTETLNPQPNDIDLITLPIITFMNLGIGSTSIIANFNFRKQENLEPEKIIYQLQNNQCNRLICSPYFLIKIASHIKEKQILLSHLKNIFTGGAPVYPDNCRLFLESFKNSEGTVLYGSTEAEPISEISFAELAKEEINPETNGVCVGKLYKEIHLAIIPITKENIAPLTKSEWQKTNLPPNKIGEIVVNGKHVLTEYYNSQEAFLKNKVKVDAEIWHRTGDAGFINNQGKLFLTGRTENLIKKGDNFLSPFIYEYILSKTEGINTGTIIDINNKATIVFEASKPLEHTEISKQIKINNLFFEEIIPLKNIPKDPRHFSKIDYEKLKKLL